MTSYQHLCTWPEDRLERCIEKLEARRLGIETDRRWYESVCDSEMLDGTDVDAHLTAAVQIIDGQLKDFREALEQVRGMDELADQNKHAAAVRERQI